MRPPARTVCPQGTILAWLALALLVIAAGTAGTLLAGCGRGGAERTAQRGPSYHCPMHPTYTSDRPGDCPICGMKLVPIRSAAAADTTASVPPAGGARRILYYRNPMNPAITSPVPRKDEMGMDYVPVWSDEVAAPTGVEGHAVVELTAQEIRLTGIQTAVARQGVLPNAIRAVGEVKADERRVRHVHTKIEGWVERLFVSSSGQLVRRGQPLLTLYSPELLATQEEFVRALEAAERFRGSDVPEVRQGGEDLVEAARRRLLLADVPRSVVDRLERTRQPRRAVTLDAPVSGYVSSKEIYEGMRIEPGVSLFTVTDLSQVWVEAQIYEYEATLVRVGQRAKLTLANVPGVQLWARVQYVYPYLDPETRTIRVRFELANPGQILKPGMYADVELQSNPIAGVLVPDAAIMDTGVRQIVYVKTGPNRFEPRVVVAGRRTGHEAVVLSGVRAGEEVVVRANFLLDSESRLRAAIAGAPKAGATAPGAP